MWTAPWGGWGHSVFEELGSGAQGEREKVEPERAGTPGFLTRQEFPDLLKTLTFLRGQRESTGVFWAESDVIGG